MTKKYLLFTYYEVKPYGGWEDYVTDFDTIEEAKKWVKNQSFKDRCHIVNQERKMIAVRGSREIRTKDYAIVSEWKFDDDKI